MWSRIRSWLRSVPSRLDGTRLDEGEQLTHLGVGASFPPSDQIAQFYADNKHRPINVKPLHIKRVQETDDDFPIG